MFVVGDAAKPVAVVHVEPFRLKEAAPEAEAVSVADCPVQMEAEVSDRFDGGSFTVPVTASREAPTQPVEVFLACA